MAACRASAAACSTFRAHAARIRRELSVPLTLKFRNRLVEDSINRVEVAQMAVPGSRDGHGARGRTRMQFTRGVPTGSRSAPSSRRSASRRRSGDVTSVAAWHASARRSWFDGPPSAAARWRTWWLFGEIAAARRTSCAGVDRRRRIAALRRYRELLDEQYPEKVIVYGGCAGMACAVRRRASWQRGAARVGLRTRSSDEASPIVRSRRRYARLVESPRDRGGEAWPTRARRAPSPVRHRRDAAALARLGGDLRRRDGADVRHPWRPALDPWTA